MNKAISTFIEDAQSIVHHFPDLKFIHPEDDIPFITGTLILMDKNEGFVDSYEIMIKPSDNYPKKFPLVFEIGNRLPHNIDWHVYPGGHCCIASIPDEILICRAGINLVSFIETHVKPYFFNQKFREVHGYFRQERSHGIIGNLEFFVSILRTSNSQKIMALLTFIKNEKEPNRTNNCFCGNGEKYRHCHKEAYKKLRTFTNDELTQYISIFNRQWPRHYGFL